MFNTIFIKTDDANLKTAIKNVGFWFNYHHGLFIGHISLKTSIEPFLKNVSHTYSEHKTEVVHLGKKIGNLDTRICILESEILRKESEFLKLQSLYPSAFDANSPEGWHHQKKKEINDCKSLVESLRKKRQLMENELKGIWFEHTNVYNGQHGDACAIVALAHGKLIYCTESSQYFIYDENCWKTDNGFSRYAYAKQLSSLYAEEAKKISKKIETLEAECKNSENPSQDTLDYINEIKEDQKIYQQKAKSLCANNYIENIFKLMRYMLPMKKQWNVCPGKIPCQNGLLDPISGTLSPHHPEHYLTNLCPISYNSYAECPIFIQFLQDISLGNQEWIDFIQRVLGYAIIGNPREEKIFVLCGSGRNGKGALMQTLENHVLGKSLCKSFKSNMLTKQKNDSNSSSANPDMIELKDTRIANFSEADESDKFDCAKVKNLTGNDTIVARPLFQKEIHFQPTHTIFLSTNIKPKVPPTEIAFWSRVIVINFDAKFTDEPILNFHRKLNPKMKEILPTEKEGILRWLIEGSREYIQKGLAVPDFIKEANLAYKQESNPVEQFVRDKCNVGSEFSCSRQKFYDEYKKYCQENNLKILFLKEVHSYMKQFYQTKDSHGQRLWMGISVIPQCKDEI